LKEEETESTGSFNWLLILWDNSELQFGRRLRTSFLILFAQQFLGINMLVYFSTQIFSQLGYSAMLSGILAGVMNTIFALASYPPIWFIERVGRRAMMFWGAIGCGICMIIYIALTTLKNPTDATNWASVVIIILYNVVFAFGWLGTCWVGSDRLLFEKNDADFILGVRSRDQSIEVPPHCRQSGCRRRVVLDFHHCLRRWHWFDHRGTKDLRVSLRPG
jgi:hypothetical protein